MKKKNWFLIVFCLPLGNFARAELPYKITIILDKLQYQAEAQKPFQTQDDVLRSYLLYASFRVDTQNMHAVSTCAIQFLPDPSNKDEWGNVISPLWEGMIAPWWIIQYGVYNSFISNNWAILPEGGVFPCALNQDPMTVGIPPSQLHTLGKTVGGNDRDHTQPPLIPPPVDDDIWMAELRRPESKKVLLILDAVSYDFHFFKIVLDPITQSHYHSSNFNPLQTQWNPHFHIQEILKAMAQWPFEK